jgi:proteasome lid subunit RPN8/RPN11
MRAPSWFRHLWRPHPRVEPLLTLEREVWNELLAELEARGRGRCESGAFLLAAREPRSITVSDVVYFDDLDPECLVGAIHLHQSAFGRLWDWCAARSLRVVGDIHTHPGSGVAQSSIDREHPMVAMHGHVGIIVPNFAQGAITPRDVGVHVYLGADGWRSHYGAAAEQRLKVASR